MQDWIVLTNADELKAQIEASYQKPVLIFKHSTRCSISQMALDRFERNWKETGSNALSICYLDLLAHRDISNQIASELQVEHQSPQILVLKNGTCVFTETHQSIRLANALEAIKN
jgi:bacillithiol system protein YtxJ